MKTNLDTSATAYASGERFFRVNHEQKKQGQMTLGSGKTLLLNEKLQVMQISRKL